MKKSENIISIAKSVLKAEAKAILNLQNQINTQFLEACQLILACKGHVIVTGVGKSGHIDQ